MQGGSPPVASRPRGRDRLAAHPDWASRHDRPACCEDLDEAKTWARGAYGPRDIVTPYGGGGFTAWYFPFGGDGVLSIIQEVAAQFKDTLVVRGGTVMPHPDLPVSPALQLLAFAINLTPEPFRTAWLAQYQWSGSTEEQAWLADLERVVERAWGFQHELFLRQPCWDWIGAQVFVDVRAHARRRTTEHLDLETYKTPAGQSLRTFGISHRVNDRDPRNARDQVMRLASTTTGPKEVDLLRRSVHFRDNSAVLTARAQRRLRAFIARYNGATRHAAFSRARIDLVGHASSSGTETHNDDLSRQRAEAVEDFLARNGLTDAPIRVHANHRGETEADQTRDDPNDRRVDLLVDGGDRMVTAVHEFGHAFGLGDEYAGNGRRVGDDAAHHDLARNMTDARGNNLPGAAIEHTGGVMSLGNEVRAQHYATFHYALEQVTAKSPWSLGNRADLASTEAMCSGAMPPCTGDTCVAGQPPQTSDVSVA